MIYTLHYPDLLPMAILRRNVDNAVYFEEYRSFREEEKAKTEFLRYQDREGEESAKPLPMNRTIDSLANSSSKNTVTCHCCGGF